MNAKLNQKRFGPCHKNGLSLAISWIRRLMQLVPLVLISIVLPNHSMRCDSLPDLQGRVRQRGRARQNLNWVRCNWYHSMHAAAARGGGSDHSYKLFSINYFFTGGGEGQKRLKTVCVLNLTNNGIGVKRVKNSPKKIYGKKVDFTSLRVLSTSFWRFELRNLHKSFHRPQRQQKSFILFQEQETAIKTRNLQGTNLWV